MKFKYLITLAIGTFLLGACENAKKSEVEDSNVAIENEETKEPTEADLLVKEIEMAHQSQQFNSLEAIQFNLDLTFGGKKRFQGTITMTPNGGQVKMKDSSNTMLWDGKKSMILPDTTNEPGAQFALLTWSYFFAAPYKLSDPGTYHEYLGMKPLGEQTYPSTKLTFGENVGQSPDDWYIVYKDNNSDLLAAMAYIVTAGTSTEEAEKDPHAITYEAYIEVEGIPFATQWNFWTWNKKGEINKLLGSATISEIKFIKKTDELFSTSVLNYSKKES